MKKNLCKLAFSLLIVVSSIVAMKAQSLSPIPVPLSLKGICDKSQGFWPVQMAMDSAKNKFSVCTENYNGQSGLEIALRIVKLDPSATQILYSKIIDANFNVITDIAVTANGTAFVVFGNQITRINPDGSVVEAGWSSVPLSEAKSIKIDSQNNLFISGQLNGNAAIVKVLSDGSIAFTQTFSGSGFEIANAIEIDSNQTVIATGRTDSTDFPSLNAFQTSLAGGTDAFLVRISSNDGTILSSSYLGGNGFDEGRGLAVGASGNIVVVGETDSLNFPTLNAIQSIAGGQKDGFISKFNNLGSSLLYSTFLGGSADDSANAVALDNNENASLAGVTFSPNFPLFRSGKTVLEGNWQAFLTKINMSGSLHLFSTYQSGGANNFYNGFDIIDDSLGGLFLSVNSNKYQGGGQSDGLILGFSPYQISLLYDSTKAFKINPSIKVQLQDLSGFNKSSANIPVTSAHVSPRGNYSVILKTLGSNFTFNAKLKFAGSALGGYEYTIDRTGLGEGDYDLVFTTANETALRAVPFSLKK